MNSNRTIRILAVPALVAALAAAGCGGNDYSGSGSAYGGKGSPVAKTPTTDGGAPARVSLAGVSGLGRILARSDGHTLYDFHKDKGATPVCYGACAATWPPLLTTGQPSAGNGVAASLLGTTKRSDGTVQVTYAGHPLYTFASDTKPGEANGQDIDSFGAEWYALKGSGEEAGD